MASEVLRAAAEERYAAELERLAAADRDPRPAGWRLSARAVRRFIIGDATLEVTRKFFGDDPLVDRSIVTLMGNAGLLLVGEPGTAKSMLAELFAAAISGHSGFVIQGSAGTIEEYLRYSWNYALLLSEGPSQRALVPSPVLAAMRAGAIVRFEEMTRCPPEVQDALVSIISEKTIAIPELGDAFAVRARPGFNVLATANLRDRGVHEMSSAIKRRFNFETVHPIDDPVFERTLIVAQLAERVAGNAAVGRLDIDVADVLVTTFGDLRRGRTADGTSLSRLDAVMSTAEAVNVAHAATLEAAFLDGTPVSGAHIARQMHGVVLKDNLDDGKKFKVYIDRVVKDRAARSKPWRDFYTAARQLRLD